MPSRPNDAGGCAPQPDLPFVPPLAHRVRRIAWARYLANTAYILLAVASWVAGNLLAILGCVVVAFIVIAHGDIDLFFQHIDNLASRYVAADAVRRAAFQHQIAWMLATMAVVLFLVRAPRFYLRLRRDLREGSGS
jgi:hypothetical protein